MPERSKLNRRSTSFAVIIAAGTAGSPAVAQSVSYSALEGHSIVAHYDELITTGRGDAFRIRWDDRVYFSTKGRIFHRFSSTSDRPGLSRTFDSVGDDQGAGDGRMAKYRWTGTGISRQWRNQRGVILRQTVDVSAAAGGGFTCLMSVERLSGSRVVATPQRQTCRVIEGNALAQR